MYKDMFDKKCTAVTKGILVIMLLVHHLFSLHDEQFEVQFFCNEILVEHIVSWGKICIAGFAFLSSFGMTRGLKSIKNKTNNVYFRYVCKRIIKLEASVLFIYFGVVIYKFFVLKEPFWQLYDLGDGFQWVYLVIDSIGLACFFGTPQINITWWYIYYALLLIISLPFLYKLYEKFRYLLIPVIMLVPLACVSLPTIAGVQNNYIILLPTAFLGIAFAYEDWFEKIRIHVKRVKVAVFQFAIGLFGLYLSYVICTYININFAYAYVVAIPFLVFLVINKIPIISNVLEFIGKHSTNIFLTHTFIYYYFYRAFIYSFKKAWIIMGIMILLCIGLSVGIEFLKVIFRYEKITNKLIIKIDNVLQKIEE